MPSVLVSESRARTLRRLMLATVVVAVAELALAIGLTIAGFQGYAVLVAAIAAVTAASAGWTLRALRAPLDQQSARQGAIITGAVLLVLSIPLVSVFVGLVTAVLGIGVLFVTLSPEPA